MTRFGASEASFEPEVIVLPDGASVAGEAADRIADILAVAVEARGRADWATTGGSMAPPIYRRLAGSPWRDRVPWGAIHVWWGDDRYVPPDHPLSNVRPLEDIFLAIAWTQGGQVALGRSGEATPVPLPLHQLHPFPTSRAIGEALGAAWCAKQLAHELQSSGPPAMDGWPVFDLVVLGVGPDGHVLSVFPGSDAFDAKDVAVAVAAPTHVEPHVERVTLNPRILTVARSILVVATGTAKSTVIHEALRGDIGPRDLPARLARRGNAIWILDTAAASGLTQPGV